MKRKLDIITKRVHKASRQEPQEVAPLKKHSLEDLLQLTKIINHNLDILKISQFPEYIQEVNSNSEKTKRKICKFFVLCVVVLAS